MGLMDSFQRQQSVWNLVKENVNYSELPEIRAVLGDTLIDMYGELYSEVEMWKKIWQELHYSEQGSRPETPVFPLADPPAIKELLKAEIQLLLLTLRERAARHGRDEEEFMAQYNPSVVSYALGSSSTQRQGSPGSWCETKKSPSRPPSSLSETGSRSFSSLSSHSCCEEEIKALRHKLNITHIDEVVSHLRSVLTEECEAMKRDVQVLQGNIEAERANRQRGPVSPEPTVAELKEERRIIQRDLKVQSFTSSTHTTNDLTTRSPQIHLRETRELDVSGNNLERVQQSKHQTVPSFHLKTCSPRDTDPNRTAVSLKQKYRSTVRASLAPVSPPENAQHKTLDPCLDHYRSISNNGKPITSSLKSHITQKKGNGSSHVDLNSSILSSVLEHGDMPKECKYKGTSARALAFRLIPAASVGSKSGSANDLMKLEVTPDINLGHLQPAPPTVQRTASRGQRGSSHPCVPQPGSLLSSL